MKKKLRKNLTEINVIDNVCPIPIESLSLLVNGEDNKNFNCLSKHITSDRVKVMLKHKETGERVKIVVPIEFLEFHKILFQDPVIPTNEQVVGVLDDRVTNWRVELIIKGIWKEDDLVINKCLQSGKLIACRIPTKCIEKTKQYINKSITKEQSHFNYSTISIWRETECQREIQVRQNLHQLMYTQTPKRV